MALPTPAPARSSARPSCLLLGAGGGRLFIRRSRDGKGAVPRDPLDAHHFSLPAFGAIRVLRTSVSHWTPPKASWVQDCGERFRSVLASGGRCQTARRTAFARSASTLDSCKY